MRTHRLLLVGLTITALAIALASPQHSHAQPASRPAAIQAARDKAAAAGALDGWWTASQKNKDDRLAWWRDARFGCFIHWGVYADPAGEWKGKRSGSYSEHIMRSNTIPLEEYKKQIVANFNPEKFNADEWASLFKEAGMRYVVITAKHHDGFAMWPSDAYPYDIRLTKFKRDPMKELAEACRKQGLKFGFYYSHSFDWEHPDAPGNDWDYKQPGGDKHLYETREGSGYRAMWYVEHPELVDRAANYVDKKCIPQLLELIDKYHPDIFWMDVGGKLPFSEQLRIVKAVREHDPNVVINGRAARGEGKNWGDYVNTSDNPAEVRPTEGDWENIPTANSSYGYNKWDNVYKTPEFVTRLMVKTNAKGGNYLFNIGPRGDGTIDEHATAILKGVGAWMKTNKESIYGTVTTPLDRQSWGDSTWNPKTNTLYLHVFDWPANGRLAIGGLQSTPSEAYLLGDAKKTRLTTERINANDLRVSVANAAPDPVDSVIVLKFDAGIQTIPGRLILTRATTNRLLAFDGKPSAGSRFSFGDGKAARYYMSGFDKPTDTVSWHYRTNNPGTYDLTVTYNTTGAQKGGPFTIKVGDQKVEGVAKPSDKLETLKVGQVTLAPGEGDIVFAPSGNGDLLQLFEVNLVPVR